ncbi:four-carbon acid sugar kinase family protein [Paenibacillus tarimensis]
MDVDDQGKQRLLCFYGDDFTGSTDAMEALAANGVRNVLFLEVPSPELLRERFSGIRSFGIAGMTRSMSPDRIAATLKPVLEALKPLGFPVVHYKICSTFDSSAETGSIGRVIDTAREIFSAQRYIPLIAGVPQLGRYTVFGHHFARSGDAVFRIDRHPTMSCHPITPMEESDLRLHLQKQTDASVTLMDIMDLEGTDGELQARLEKKLSDAPDVVLFDVLDERRLEQAGALVWKEAADQGGIFVIGSSGVEYGLTAHWRKNGHTRTEREDARLTTAAPAGQILVASGSCSPVTFAQIRWALNHGFAGIKLPVVDLLRPERSEAVVELLVKQAVNIINGGSSLIIYSAEGPQDPVIEEAKAELIRQGYAANDSGRLIGRQLGKISKAVIERTRLTRFVAAGGDTSGYVTSEFGIYALECLALICPGGPLCVGYSEHPRFDGLQLSLKGGQVGPPDYFGRVLEGR